MANNNISQYYKVDGGTDLTSDSQFSALGAGTKLIYKPTCDKYIKNANYSNVFDKANSGAVGKIGDANDNGVSTYYGTDGTPLGTFKCGLPIIGTDGATNVNPISQNGSILTVEVPKVKYDKYGRVVGWEKQSATAIVSSGSSSGVGYTGVPIGTISMWAGGVGDIPSGWHLCDGTAGTPDLRNRFIIGAGASYNPGTTGGSATIFGSHYHYIGYGNSSQDGYHLGTEGKNFKSSLPTIPNAVIKFNDYEGDSGRGWSSIDRDSNDGWNSANGENLVTSLNYANGSDTTGSEGEYLPPYYALCYIMKVQADGSPTVVVNNNPTLNFGQNNITIGTVDNKPLTVNMPSLGNYLNFRNPYGVSYDTVLEWHDAGTQHGDHTDFVYDGWYLVTYAPNRDKIHTLYYLGSGSGSSGTGRIIIPGYAGTVGNDDFTGGILNNTYTTGQIHTGILNGQYIGGGDGSMYSGTNQSVSASRYYAPATWKCIKAPDIHTESGGNKVLGSQGYFELIEYNI